MHSSCKGLLFMHGHIVDADLARRLADAEQGPASGPRAEPPPWLRRLADLLGWLGCGAVRAWPN